MTVGREHRTVRRLALATSLTLTAGLGVAIAAPPALAVQTAQNALVRPVPVTWTPNVLGSSSQVEAVVQIGSLTIVAGTFTQVQAAGSTTTLTRNNILGFNSTTGALSTTFVPTVSGEVTTLLPSADGTAVYLGGNFNTVNGTASASLAELSVSNGALVPAFHAPTMNGRVRDLKLAGGRLWVSGTWSTIAGQAQRSMATLNPTTGAFDSFMRVPISGVHNGGGTEVIKFDITPDGSRLVGIGNFTTVGGTPHEQVFMLDLTGANAALANWQTNFYTSICASVFNTYMRDLDISPDGKYFVISVTGAYGGSTGACDETSRWDFSATGSDLQTTWTDYTGGDTTYAVAITGTAVYVGGHMRWQNNPYAGDSAGPGAVAREGIAALDPSNGLPFNWNPTRDRGVGVFDMLATSQGLWVVSDTDHIGGAYHAKVAFLPLAGGEVVPTPKTPVLPADVYLAGRTGTNASSTVLYRVNAAGPTLLATDSGPDWTGDTADAPDSHHGAGSNTADWGSAVGSLDSSVAASTPIGLFNTERWAAQSWSFPVTTGTQIRVDLFFANRCSCTNFVGGRVFDVAIDGTTVLDHYDIVADVGDNRGVEKSFAATSDGSVDIDLSQLTENPLVNGIEIIRTGPVVPPPPPSPVLYRVNGGGDQLGSLDSGPAWAGDASGAPDSHHDSTSSTGAYAPIANVSGSVSASTPSAVFDSERWGPQSWSFPVAAGTNLQVNLFFANRYSGTANPGDRVFDVAVDGTTVLDHYDIVADVGDQTGVEKTFTVVSDGSVDITLSQETENPLIDGIEIVSTDPVVPPPPPTPINPDQLQKRSYDGSTVGANSDVTGTGISWGLTRGAVLLNGKLYTAWADGNLYARSFNGTTFGPASVVNTQDLIVPLTDWHADVQNMTGLFYESGKLYYTESGQSTLYYRYFTPESGVVGALRFATQGNVSGVDWSAISGTFLSGNILYFATKADGNLHAVSWQNGAAVGGTSSVVSGPGLDGNDWSTRAMFLYAAPVVQNQPPSAAFTSTCSNLDCTFNGAGSSDPDGTIASYAWNFGDSNTGSGVGTSHSYGAGNTYTVTLTVTDNGGLTSTVTHPVTVSPATTSSIAFRATATAQTSGTVNRVTVPAAVRAGDGLLLFASSNSANAVTAGPAGWTLVGEQTSGTPDMRTRLYSKVATAGDAGAVVSVTYAASNKANLTVTAYSGTNLTSPVAAFAMAGETVSRTAHTAPGTSVATTGSWVVSYYADKSSATTGWTAPAGQVQRSLSIGTSSGRITSLEVDSGAGTAAGPWTGLTATASNASAKATMWSVVLAPA